MRRHLSSQPFLFLYKKSKLKAMVVYSIEKRHSNDGLESRYSRRSIDKRYLLRYSHDIGVQRCFFLIHQFRVGMQIS